MLPHLVLVVAFAGFWGESVADTLIVRMKMYASLSAAAIARRTPRSLPRWSSEVRVWYDLCRVSRTCSPVLPQHPKELCMPSQ